MGDKTSDSSLVSDKPNNHNKHTGTGRELDATG